MRANVIIGCLLMACSIDSTDSEGGLGKDDVAPDAATGNGGAGGSDGGVGIPEFACRERVTTGIGDGHHNAGLDCMGSCHNHGFSLAGTLYTSATGSKPVVGASITVVDGAGNTLDMVSQQNGNFWTKQVLVFPVKVTASLCPDVRKMPVAVPAKTGCNKCHQIGAVGRIHLP
jgi:hypothetical protein